MRFLPHATLGLPLFFALPFSPRVFKTASTARSSARVANSCWTLMMQCSPNTKGVEEEVRRWEKYSFAWACDEKSFTLPMTRQPWTSARRGDRASGTGPLQRDGDQAGREAPASCIRHGDWWTWFDTQPIQKFRWSKPDSQRLAGELSNV